jgi:uncharacterized protein YbcC (UPF0753/DUF2309 family)
MRECLLKAVNQARKFLNANVFPESSVFRQAWEKGEIDEKLLLKLLEKTNC